MIERRSYSHFVGGIAICFLGAICFSTKAIFVKLAFRDTDVDAVTLLALRMLFALPFFVVSAFLSSKQRGNVRFTPAQWLGVAVVGCLGYYVASLLDFLGLQYISAGMERLILFIYPTLVLLMSAVIFKVRIKMQQWLALLITYVGMFIAFVGEASFQADNENFYTGAILIFICAVTFAMYIVGSGRLIPVLGAAKFNSYAMSFAALAVLTHFAITSDKSLLGQSTTVYFYSICMAIVSTVIPSYLISEGIKRVGSGNAAIVGSIGPVSTIVQAYFFLYEPIHLMQVIGTALILAGVLMIGNKKQKAQ